MLGQINSINIGQARSMNDSGKEVVTGIFKSPIKGAVYLGKLGLQGDEQADLIHHGGEDKAVCVYPFEHYSYWEKRLQKKLGTAAFGENITVAGLEETKVNIGDIFTLGEAIVQVSQPRQPCVKLAIKHGISNLPSLIQKTGYTGYYFRVLSEGWIDRNVTIKLLEVAPEQVTVQYGNEIMYKEQSNIEGLKKLLGLKALSASWREMLTTRLVNRRG